MSSWAVIYTPNAQDDLLRHFIGICELNCKL